MFRDPATERQVESKPSEAPGADRWIVLDETFNRAGWTIEMHAVTGELRWTQGANA